MFWLKQSTAVDLKLGPFVDKTDGVTYEIAMAAAMDHATTGVRVSKNGGVFGDRSDSNLPVYDAFGYYLVKLDATDTNTVGRLTVIFGDAAVCRPVEMTFMVLPANVYDSLMGADKLQVHADEITAGLITATALATGAITSAKFAAGAIDAAAIAAGAIDNATFAADVGSTAYATNIIALATRKALDDYDPPTKTELDSGFAGQNDLSAAEVNAEVVDALNVDAYAEIGQESPAATQTIRKMLQFLYKSWRNKGEQTATTLSLYNDAGSVVDQKATVSDDTTTFTKGEIVTGP